MAANITLKCGTGVASITYAWVNSSGTRTPPSGTDTTTSSVDMDACDHVWISSVTASSGYTSPYKIDRTSFTSSYTYYPSVGGTKNVIATKIQTSYKVRLAKYVDNVYQTETTFTTTSQIMSGTAVKNKIPSSWASSDIELKDPWFGTLSGCRYDQNEGEFTFTSTSPTINVAYTKIVVPTYNYYLRYHANGGTGGPNDQSTIGTTVTSVTFKIPSTEPTRTNYTFLGWSFDSTATKASYVSGDIVTLSSEKPDRTLYAVWKYTPTYNYYLRYHANGGTGGPNTQSTLETTVTSVTFKVPSTEPTRTNYTFLGWSFDSTATEADYVGGDTVYLYSEKPDRTLYAVWKYTPKYNYYLRYNANGGTGGPNDQSNLGTTDTSVTFKVPSTEPTRTNYTFLGWSFDSTDTEASYVSGNTVTLYSGNPDRTLYAVWKISVIKPAITYVSHTDTTIKISLDRNGATAGSWIIEASLSNFGTVVYTTTITSTSQTTITLTRLTPEKTYYIRARHVIGDVSASSNVISATTRTSTFQWTSDDSRYVVKDAVFTDVITAEKWKELIKKVNWCRKKNGWPVVSLNDAVRGQPILAKDFTDMRNAIADMHAVTPAREPDDEILATYFANSDTSLKSAINAVITTL